MPLAQEVGKKLAFRNQARDRIAADRFSLILFFVCIFAILGQVALILVSWGKLPPQIPLYFSRPWGEEMLAKPLAFWILPGVAGFSFIVNFFIAFFAVEDNIFLMRTLVTFALIVSLATLYDVVKIVSLLV